MSYDEMLNIQAIYEKYWKGDIDLPTLVYNIQVQGDWKRQLATKPTPEQMAYAALYEWKPDSDYSKRINRELTTYNLRGRFADFQVPTLIIEGNDPTWGENKPQVLKENHPNA